MPISGNIYQTNQPVRRVDPAGVLASVTQLRQTIREEQAATQAEQDQETVHQVLQSTGGDVDATIKRLREVGAWGVADALEKSDSARRKSRADVLKAQLENKTASDRMMSGFVAAALNENTPEAVERLKGQISTIPLSPDDPPDSHAKLVEQLGTFDPVKTPALLQQWADGLQTEEQQDTRHRENLKLLYGNDPIRGMAGLLAATTGVDDYRDEYGAILSTVHNREQRELLKAQFPDPSQVTPETFAALQQHLADVSMTDTEKTNRMNAETAAKNAAQAGSGVTLSQGQKRFERQPDGTLKEVASVAPRPVAQSGGGSGGGGTTTTKMPPQARSVLARVLTGMPGTRTGTIVQEANRLAQTGDENALKSYLRYAATQKVGEARQTVMQGRMETLSALKDAEAMLKEVPTSYLRGTWENAARALGKTSDPRLVELGSRMGNILAQYMRSISGAAVNEQEAKRLSALIPNYKNDLTVNLAELKGFSESIKSFDKAFYQNTFGEHYDWVMSGTNQPMDAPANVGAADAVTVPDDVKSLLSAQPDNRRYKMTNGDVYEKKNGTITKVVK